MRSERAPEKRSSRKAHFAKRATITDAEAAVAPPPLDIFAHLNGISSPTDPLLRDPILQRMAVTRYEGEVNERGFFHGTGKFESTLGFTYDGELDKGLMHGKGTIRWKHGVVYSGSFVNNMPCGKGKYEWSNGDWYDGEVEHSVRNGQGTFFNAALNETYSGTWRSGKRHGHGKLQYTEKCCYVGAWNDDKRSGHGSMTYHSGDRYDGMWMDDRRHGKGTMTWMQNDVVVEIYEGEWKEGIQHGQGFTVYIRPPVRSDQTATAAVVSASTLESAHDYLPPRGSALNTYRGAFECGKRHGFGVFIYDDGSKYEGDWFDNQKHGQGRFTSTAGISTIEIYDHGHRVEMEGQKPAIDQPATDPTGPPEDSNVLSVSETTQALPPIYIRDLIGVSETHVSDLILSVQSMLSRNSGILKRVFSYYSTLDTAVAFVTTHPHWRKDVIQGTMTLPQLYRLLNETKLLNRSVTIASVDRMLATFGDAAHTTEAQRLAVGAEDREYENMWQHFWQHKMYTADGFISYREFMELLVRVAAELYSEEVFGNLSQKLHIVIEDHLSAAPLSPSSALPLCGASRIHKDVIMPHLSILKNLFLHYSDATSLGHGNMCGSALVAKKHSELHSLGTPPQAIAGVLVRARQLLLLLKETGAFESTKLTLGAILRTLLPFERFGSATAQISMAHLLPPVYSNARCETTSDRASVYSAVPPSEATSATSPSAHTAAVSRSTHGFSEESTYRHRWALRERSKGLHHGNVKATLQVERELTFVEFTDVIVECALLHSLEASPEVRVQSFFKNYLLPLHEARH
jgi:hypothetical protein